jgi:hypothetical protein
VVVPAGASSGPCSSGIPSKPIVVAPVEPDADALDDVEEPVPLDALLLDELEPQPPTISPARTSATSATVIKNLSLTGAER